MVSLRASEVTALAGVAGEPNPIDEGDFPGPVLRWYGDADGLPVIVTHHEGQPTGDYTDLTLELPPDGHPPWRALEPLIVHAPELLQRVSWVLSADPEGPVAVRARSPEGVEERVYCTRQAGDAAGLATLLARTPGGWRYDVVDLRDRTSGLR